MARVHELEEQHGAVLAQCEVADLVHYEQCGVRQHLEPAREVAGLPGLDERLDQACQRAVVNTASGLGGGDREADREMRLADAARRGSTRS